MSDDWRIPEGSNVTKAEARAMIAGPYGAEAARYTIDCCLPLGWFETSAQYVLINSGTATLVKPPSGRTFGITAAHVIRGYQADLRKYPALGARLGDADIGDLANRIIDVNDALDLATIDLNDGLLRRVSPAWGRVLVLELWPPKPPAEDRGIMLAGYPARMRWRPAAGQLMFVPWVVLSVARGVSDDQITWRFASEYLASTPLYPVPAEEAFQLGGISGGPVLRVGESPSGIVAYRLARIISEARPEYECVIARRADYVREDGSIMPAPPR
ncbi:MAG TPA: hypothetical protein VMT68_10575 [Caulobacteraceae bacterium]|nr:hypothetical protein [Caulobacteraceae bacterium]